MNELPDNLRELAANRAVGKGGTPFITSFDEMAHIPARGSGSGKSIAEMLTEARERVLSRMIKVPYSGHPIMPSAVEQFCVAREFQATRGASVLCGEHATHKVGEEGGDPTVHNLTAYVCCEHFRSFMGRCS